MLVLATTSLRDSAAAPSTIHIEYPATGARTVSVPVRIRGMVSTHARTAPFAESRERATILCGNSALASLMFVVIVVVRVIADALATAVERTTCWAGAIAIVFVTHLARWAGIRALTRARVIHLSRRTRASSVALVDKAVVGITLTRTLHFAIIPLFVHRLMLTAPCSTRFSRA